MLSFFLIPGEQSVDNSAFVPVSVEPVTQEIYEQLSDFEEVEIIVFEDEKYKKVRLNSRDELDDYDDVQVFANYEYQALMNDVTGFLNVDLINTQYTGDGVKLAVLDTGVNLDVIAKSFVEEDVTDYNGHGTFVAKIVQRISPDTQIYSAKVLDADGRGDTLSIVSGINWAVEQDVDIISMSLGADRSFEDILITQAIDHAIENGIVVVVASGNCRSGCSDFHGVTTPGNLEQVISVGSIEDSGQVSSFSSSESFETYSKPDLVSYGKNVKVDGYYKSGTSFSTPQVSAMISLLIESDSSLDHNSIKTMLPLITTDVGDEGFDIDTGYGVIDFTNYLDLEVNETVVEINETEEVVNESFDSDEFYWQVYESKVNVSGCEDCNGSLTQGDESLEVRRVYVKLPKNISFTGLNLSKEIYYESINNSGNFSDQAVGITLNQWDDYAYSTGGSSDGIVWVGGEHKKWVTGEEWTGYHVICYDWIGDGEYDQCHGPSEDDVVACSTSDSELLYLYFDGKLITTWFASIDHEFETTVGSSGTWSASTDVKYFANCDGSNAETATDDLPFYVVNERQYVCTSSTEYADRSSIPGGYVDFGSKTSCSSSEKCDYDQDGDSADFGNSGTTTPDDPCRKKEDQSCSSNSQCYGDLYCSNDRCCPSGEEYVDGDCIVTCNEGYTGNRDCSGDTPRREYINEDCTLEMRDQTSCSNTQQCDSGYCDDLTCDDFTGAGSSCSTSGEYDRVVSNTVSQCQDFLDGSGQVLCWATVASNGENNFCDLASNTDYLCEYGQFDCDSDDECSGSLECKDDSGTGCESTEECGCCNAGQLWNEQNNQCENICYVSNALWAIDDTYEGDTVDIQITGVQCSSIDSVNVKIYESDGTHDPQTYEAFDLSTVDDLIEDLGNVYFDDDGLIEMDWETFYDSGDSYSAWSNYYIRVESTHNTVESDLLSVDLCSNADSDGDGYYVSSICGNLDCDDTSADIYPGASEMCNEIDDDCDGSVDEIYDLDYDGDNCGTCGTSCDSGSSCQSGSCILDPYCGDNICNNAEDIYSCSSDCGIELTNIDFNPKTIDVGNSFTMSFTLDNPSVNTINLGLGASIVDSLDQSSDDASNDDVVTVNSGENVYTRNFNVDEGLSNGIYDVVFGVHKVNDGEFYEMLTVDTLLDSLTLQGNCGFPFGSSEQCQCASNSECEAYGDYFCDLSGEFNQCLEIEECEFADGSSSFCDCDSNSDCGSGYVCNFVDGWDACVEETIEDECSTIDDYSCQGGDVYVCEQGSSNKYLKLIDVCSFDEVCPLDVDVVKVCESVGNIDLQVEKASSGVVVYRQVGDILHIYLDVDSSTSKDLIYDSEVFELQGDCFANVGRNLCTFEVKEIGLYEFSFGDNTELVSVINDPYLVHMTHVDNLANEFGVNGANLILSKSYEHASRYKGIVYDIQSELVQENSEYAYVTPVDTNDYVDEIANLIRSRCGDCKEVMIIGNDEVVPAYEQTFESDTYYTDSYLSARQNDYDLRDLKRVFNKYNNKRFESRNVLVIEPDSINNLDDSIDRFKGTIRSTFGDTITTVSADEISCSQARFYEATNDVPVVIIGTKDNNKILRECYGFFGQENSMYLERSIWDANEYALILNTDDENILDFFSLVIGSEDYKSYHARSMTVTEKATLIGGTTLIVVGTTASLTGVGATVGVPLAYIGYTLDASVVLDQCVVNTEGGSKWDSCAFSVAAPVGGHILGKAGGKVLKELFKQNGDDAIRITNTINEIDSKGLLREFEVGDDAALAARKLFDIADGYDYVLSRISRADLIDHLDNVRFPGKVKYTADNFLTDASQIRNLDGFEDVFRGVTNGDPGSIFEVRAVSELRRRGVDVTSMSIIMPDPAKQSRTLTEIDAYSGDTIFEMKSGKQIDDPRKLNQLTRKLVDQKSKQLTYNPEAEHMVIFDRDPPIALKNALANENINFEVITWE